MRELDEITGSILDAALKLHSNLGPGLLESVYEAILAGSLERAGLDVERQKSVDIRYEDMAFRAAFRVDLLVEKTVIVEIKSVEQVASIHAKQLLTYLRLMDLTVGLLINFGAPLLRSGVRRVVNGYRPSATSRLRVNQSTSEG